MNDKTVNKMDDITRHTEIKDQIQWKKAHSRRESVLGAAEIFRVLKTKKHEFDCFGTSLVNLQYGVEVVNMMKYLNKSYVEDRTSVFQKNLERELASAMALRDTCTAVLNERKNVLKDISSDELRELFLKDLEEGKDLITRRYKSFRAYFTFIMQQHRNIAGVVEVADELKVIKTLVTNSLAAVEKKIGTIREIMDSLLVEWISNDIDKSIEVLNCQADNLPSHIMQSIEETNALLSALLRPEDLMEGDDEKELDSSDHEGLKGDDDDVGDDKGSRKDSSGGDEDGLKGDEVDDGGDDKGSGEDRIEGDEVDDGGDGKGEGESSDITSEGDDDSALECLMAAALKPLIQGLTHCALRNPADPICFVSKYIKYYRENEDKAERKYEYLKLLLAERARKRLVKKMREEEEQRRRQLDEVMHNTFSIEEK